MPLLMGGLIGILAMSAPVILFQIFFVNKNPWGYILPHSKRKDLTPSHTEYRENQRANKIVWNGGRSTYTREYRVPQQYNVNYARPLLEII